MTRYKTDYVGSGYDEWIANLNMIGGREKDDSKRTPEHEWYEGDTWDPTFQDPEQPPDYEPPVPTGQISDRIPLMSVTAFVRGHPNATIYRTFIRYRHNNYPLDRRTLYFVHLITYGDDNTRMEVCVEKRFGVVSVRRDIPQLYPTPEWVLGNAYEGISLREFLTRNLHESLWTSAEINQNENYIINRLRAFNVAIPTSLQNFINHQVTMAGGGNTPSSSRIVEPYNGPLNFSQGIRTFLVNHFNPKIRFTGIGKWYNTTFFVHQISYMNNKGRLEFKIIKISKTGGNVTITTITDNVDIEKFTSIYVFLGKQLNGITVQQFLEHNMTNELLQSNEDKQDINYVINRLAAFKITITTEINAVLTHTRRNNPRTKDERRLFLEQYPDAMIINTRIDYHENNEIEPSLVFFHTIEDKYGNTYEIIIEMKNKSLIVREKDANYRYTKTLDLGRIFEGNSLKRFIKGGDIYKHKVEIPDLLNRREEVIVGNIGEDIFYILNRLHWNHVPEEQIRKIFESLKKFIEHLVGNKRITLELEEAQGSGFGLENNILTNNKMPKKKFGNTDTQLYQDMLGGSMHEMGLDGMEGEGVYDWLYNLVDVIRKPKQALGKMPKPIWEFNQKYNNYGFVSMEVCREPLSKGLTNIIDRASRGDLIKNLAKSPYEDLFHLYANVYLKEPLSGKTKSFRIEKNQRVEVFDNIVPPKGASGKCMGVPNIPMKNGLPTLGWFKFWENTDNTTWEYSANKYNCQSFLKSRLEAAGLLTPALKDFILQDIDTILDPVKNKFQISVAKGITDFANIMQNIYKGGEMGGDGHCGCESQCGCGKKKSKKQRGGWVEPHVHYKEGDYPDVTSQNVSLGMSKYYPVQTDPRQIGKGKKQRGGWVEPHIHQVWPREGVGWTGEVRAQYTDPDFGKH